MISPCANNYTTYIWNIIHTNIVWFAAAGHATTLLRHSDPVFRPTHCWLSRYVYICCGYSNVVAFLALSLSRSWKIVACPALMIGVYFSAVQLQWQCLKVHPPPLLPPPYEQRHAIRKYPLGYGPNLAHNPPANWHILAGGSTTQPIARKRGKTGDRMRKYCTHTATSPCKNSAYILHFQKYKRLSDIL